MSCLAPELAPEGCKEAARRRCVVCSAPTNQRCHLGLHLLQPSLALLCCQHIQPKVHGRETESLGRVQRLCPGAVILPCDGKIQDILCQVAVLLMDELVVKALPHDVLQNRNQLGGANIALPDTCVAPLLHADGNKPCHVGGAEGGQREEVRLPPAEGRELEVCFDDLRRSSHKDNAPRLQHALQDSGVCLGEAAREAQVVAGAVRNAQLPRLLVQEVT
mmetsp:Transcript_95788/g.309255  ORF Transcript_95788/g.309255 Transcript_95788/m.309255 type:complete len:219 (+) Transcript_95788:3307-3963(+)